MLPAGRKSILSANGNLTWVLLANQNQNNSNSKDQKHLVDSNPAGRFLRITFQGSENKTVAISEVEVYGKPAY